MEVIESINDIGASVYILKDSIVYFIESPFGNNTIVKLKSDYSVRLGITPKEFIELLQSKPN